MAVVRVFLSLLTLQVVIAIRVRKTDSSLADDAEAAEGLSRGREDGHGATTGDSHVLDEQDTRVRNSTRACASFTRVRTPARRRSPTPAPTPEPDWDRLEDAPKDAINLVTSTLSFVRDPSLASAGAAIEALAPIASMALMFGGFAPPAGPAVGAAIGLVGGLMSLYGDEPEPPPQITVEVIQGNISAGFEQIGDRLTDIADRLSLIDQAIGQISAQLEELNKLVGQLWMETLTADYQEIHEIWKTALYYLGNGQIGSLLPELHCRQFNFVKFTRNDFTNHTVLRVLDFAQSSAGPCAGIEHYRDILAARTEIASLLFMGSMLNQTFQSGMPLFPLNDASSGPNIYLEDMTQNIRELDELVLGRYPWTQDMLTRTAAELSSLPSCQPTTTPAPTPPPTPPPTPAPTPRFVPSCVERESAYLGTCDCLEGEYLAYCDDGWSYDIATCCVSQLPNPGCRRVVSGYGGTCGGLCSANEYMQSCEDGWIYDAAICCA